MARPYSGRTGEPFSAFPSRTTLANYRRLQQQQFQQQQQRSFLDIKFPFISNLAGAFSSANEKAGSQSGDATPSAENLMQQISNPKQISSYLKSQFRAPQHPIIMCHGLLGFDVIGFRGVQLHYWRGIAEALQLIGASVIVTRVPRTADVSVRAATLKATLDAKVDAGELPRGAQVNLVGHSMVPNFSFRFTPAML
jgi:hypothetical protein